LQIEQQDNILKSKRKKEKKNIWKLRFKTQRMQQKKKKKKSVPDLVGGSNPKEKEAPTMNSSTMFCIFNPITQIQ
jgi:hypothetical protein